MQLTHAKSCERPPLPAIMQPAQRPCMVCCGPILRSDSRRRRRRAHSLVVITRQTTRARCKSDCESHHDVGVVVMQPAQHNVCHEVHSPQCNYYNNVNTRLVNVHTDTISCVCTLSRTYTVKRLLGRRTEVWSVLSAIAAGGCGVWMSTLYCVACMHLYLRVYLLCVATPLLLIMRCWAEVEVHTIMNRVE